MMNSPMNSSPYQRGVISPKLTSKTNTRRSRSPGARGLVEGSPSLFIDVLQQNGLLESSSQKIKERRQNDSTSIKRNANSVAHSLAMYSNVNHEMNFFCDVFNQNNSMVKKVGSYMATRKVVRNFFSSKPSLDNIKLLLNVWTTLVNKIFKDQPPFQIIERLKQRIAAINKQRALDAQNDRNPPHARTRNLEMSPYTTHSHNLDVDALQFILLCAEELQNPPKPRQRSGEKRPEILNATNISPNITPVKHVVNESPNREFVYRSSPIEETIDYTSMVYIRPPDSNRDHEEDNIQRSIKVQSIYGELNEQDYSRGQTPQPIFLNNSNTKEDGEFNAIIQERSSIKKDLSVQTIEKRAALQKLLCTVEAYNQFSQRHIEAYNAIKDIQKAFGDVVEKVRSSDSQLSKDLNPNFLQKFITSMPFELDTTHITSIKTKFDSKGLDLSKANLSDSQDGLQGVDKILNIDGSFQPRIFTSKLPREIIEQQLKEANSPTKQEARAVASRQDRPLNKSPIAVKSTSVINKSNTNTNTKQSPIKVLVDTPAQMPPIKEPSMQKPPTDGIKTEVNSDKIVTNTKPVPIRTITPKETEVIKKEETVKSKPVEENKTAKSDIKVYKKESPTVTAQTKSPILLEPENKITKEPINAIIESKGKEQVKKTPPTVKQEDNPKPIMTVLEPEKTLPPLLTTTNKNNTTETKEKEILKPSKILSPKQNIIAEAVKPEQATISPTPVKQADKQVPAKPVESKPTTIQPSVAAHANNQPVPISTHQPQRTVIENKTEPVKPAESIRKIPPPPVKTAEKEAITTSVNAKEEVKKPEKLTVIPEAKPATLTVQNPKPVEPQKQAPAAVISQPVAQKPKKAEPKVIVIKLPPGASLVKGQLPNPPEINTPLAIQIIMGSNFEKVLAKDPQLVTLHNAILQRQPEEYIIQEAIAAPKPKPQPQLPTQLQENAPKLAVSLPTNATVIKGTLPAPPSINVPVGIKIVMGNAFEQTLAKNPELAALHQTIMQRKPEPPKEEVPAPQPKATQVATSSNQSNNNGSIIKGQLPQPPKISVPLAIQVAMGPAFDKLLAKDPEAAKLHQEILKRRSEAPVEEVKQVQLQPQSSSTSANQQSNNTNIIKGDLPAPPKIAIPLAIQVAMGPAFEKLLAKDPEAAKLHQEILKRKSEPPIQAVPQPLQQTTTTSNSQTGASNIIKGELPAPPKISIPLGIQVAMGPAFEKLLAKDPEVAKLHQEIMQRKPEPPKQEAPQAKLQTQSIASTTNTQAGNTNFVKGDLPAPPKISIPLGIEIAMGAAFSKLLASDPQAANLHNEILKRKSQPSSDTKSEQKEEVVAIKPKPQPSNVVTPIKGELPPPNKITLPPAIQLLTGFKKYKATDDPSKLKPALEAANVNSMQQQKPPEKPESKPTEVKPQEENKAPEVVVAPEPAKGKFSVPKFLKKNAEQQQSVDAQPKTQSVNTEAKSSVDQPIASSNTNPVAQPPVDTVKQTKPEIVPATSQVSVSSEQPAKTSTPVDVVKQTKPEIVPIAPQASVNSDQSAKTSAPVVDNTQKVEVAPEQTSADTKPKFAVPKFLKKNAEQNVSNVVEPQNSSVPQNSSQTETVKPVAVVAQSAASTNMEAKHEDFIRATDNKSIEPSQPKVEAQGLIQTSTETPSKVEADQSSAPAKPKFTLPKFGQKPTSNPPPVQAEPEKPVTQPAAPNVSNPAGVMSTVAAPQQTDSNKAEKPLPTQPPTDTINPTQPANAAQKAEESVSTAPITKPKFTLPKFGRKATEDQNPVPTSTERTEEVNKKVEVATVNQLQPVANPPPNQSDQKPPTQAQSQPPQITTPPLIQSETKSADPENKIEKIETQPLPVVQAQPQVQPSVEEQTSSAPSTKPKFTLPKFGKKPATEQAPVPAGEPQGQANNTPSISQIVENSSVNNKMDSANATQPQTNNTSIAVQPPFTELKTAEPENKIQEEQKSQTEATSQPLKEEQPAASTAPAKPKFTLPKFGKKPAADQTSSDRQSTAATTNTQSTEHVVNAPASNNIEPLKESVKQTELPVAVEAKPVSTANTAPIEEGKVEPKIEAKPTITDVPVVNTEAPKTVENAVKETANEAVNKEATAAPVTVEDTEAKPIEKKFAPPKFKVPKFTKKTE